MSTLGSHVPFAPTAIDRGVARAVLLGAVPASAHEPERSDAVARFTAARILGCPAPMRAGVRLVGLTLASVAFATRRVRVDAAPAADVERALRPWLRLPLPGVAEYARLVRSLVVVGWFDGVGAP
jgi:hypothetical protein